MSNSSSVSKPIKVKTKGFKPRRQKAKLFRASEPFLSVFMWGINYTVNELTHVSPPAMLMPDDFKASIKVKVDNHCFNKENMPSHFKVKEYCPLVFKNLRERFHIDELQYLNSLSKHAPRPASNKGSAKFYESYDHIFLLKVLTSDEVETMHHLLKEYHPYIVERHGKTLMPQYLGMYRITADNAETYIGVMRNICSSSLPIHCKYDLKGSTVDREASQRDKNAGIPVFKDNDFTNAGIKLYADDDWKRRFFEMLNADTEFLTKKNIMDYSLCVAIHDCARDEEEKQRAADEKLGSPGSAEDEEGESSGDGNYGGLQQQNSIPSPPDSPEGLGTGECLYNFHSDSMINPSRDYYAVISSKDAPKREIYFIGIVDILTQFGIFKRTALAAKTVKHGPTAEISTAHPEQYAKRFVDFITKAFN